MRKGWRPHLGQLAAKRKVNTGSIYLMDVQSEQYQPFPGGASVAAIAAAVPPLVALVAVLLSTGRPTCERQGRYDASEYITQFVVTTVTH
jgi:hypothetical protein